MMFDDTDTLIEARQERAALWAAACRGEITTEQLLARLRELHRQVGDALYARTGR